MDHLRSFFAANRDQVAANIAASRVPSPEQLDAFVRNLCAHVAKILGGGAPARVRQICSSNFAEIGWDTRRNRPADGRRRTPEQLLEFLQKTLAELNNWSPVVQPTDEELADFAAACNKLWELDVNRLAPGEDYRINLQRGKTPYQPGDAAPDPLFEFVSPAAFRKPTYAAFIALLDNYERNTGVAEVVTEEEKRENRSFLELCMDTAVLQYVHQYLVRMGKVPASPEQFLQRLNELWFTMYRREVEGDSSGFEHVFLGESKGGEVSGMHNWIQLYLEERAGRLDYKGYIKPKVKALGVTVPSEYEQLITIQFSWYDELKPVSSSFIGVSPEFEVALYSLFFFMGHEKLVVPLGPYRAEITVHRYRSRGRDYIGTAYPGPAPLTEDQAATKIQATFRRKQATKAR